MTDIRIPDHLKDGFNYLANLATEEAAKLAKLLEELPPGNGPIQIADSIEKKMQLENAQEIADVLYSFGNLLLSQERTHAELAAILSESYSNGDSDQLEENLIQIFKSCDNLKMGTKAIILQSENNFVYKSSRIVTDIRYIFQNQNEILNDDGKFAVLIHQFRISSYHNKGSREFYISLDKNDLITIRKQIDRALEKQSFIEANLKEKVQFIELTQ